MALELDSAKPNKIARGDPSSSLKLPPVWVPPDPDVGRKNGSRRLVQ
ncbi:uncharacterized protein DNG_01258 [Cephalotrichum gorgonifer]|uniref:Uncharacterized protein n=1 Tax=Cephalotrichum gorgonifer TaxID=2041049 RepID=A0AAE8MRF7_9PEZI|nr:uncharacterized protein DNG_01258 [Cephalotrichum gorgonifer]